MWGYPHPDGPISAESAAVPPPASLALMWTPWATFEAEGSEGAADALCQHGRLQTAQPAAVRALAIAKGAQWRSRVHKRQPGPLKFPSTPTQPRMKTRSQAFGHSNHAGKADPRPAMRQKCGAPSMGSVHEFRIGEGPRLGKARVSS